MTGEKFDLAFCLSVSSNTSLAYIISARGPSGFSLFIMSESEGVVNGLSCSVSYFFNKGYIFTGAVIELWTVGYSY